MDLRAHPELSARFVARRRFDGGEGSSWIVDEPGGGRSNLLLKVLSPGADLREPGLLASLRHPRIPTVLEVGRTARGAPWVLRTLAPGRSLAELGTITAEDGEQVCGRLLETLAFVHARGILHLDLKPANVVVDRDVDGAVLEPWLLDFGMGLREGGGVRGGTPFFAAPELLLGVDPDPRADLFSLGATILASVLPDVGSRVAEFLRRFPRDDFLTAAGVDLAELPAPLDTVLQRLVERRPADRFADAQEALEALGRRGGSGRPTIAALALDPAAAHSLAIESALDALAEGVDVEILGGDSDDRNAVAIQLACRLGDARSVGGNSDRVCLDRGGRGVRSITLEPLDDALLGEHLRRAVGLDGESARSAARAMLAAGVTTATAAAGALSELAARGVLVPDGPRWSWPDALSGRLDLRPAPAPGSPLELRDAAACGRIEAAFNAFRVQVREHPDAEVEWRSALADGLLSAGEPLRALPFVHGLPALHARCLFDLGRVDAAAAAIDAIPVAARALDAVRRVEAGIAFQRGAFDDGLRVLDAARREDPHNQIVRAFLLTALGRLRAAGAELGDVLDRLDAGRAPFPRASALSARGELARRDGDLAAACADHAEALALYRALGNVRNTASASLNLGVALKDCGRYDDAREALRRARSLYEHVEDVAGTWLAEANLGIVQLAAGDARSAVERFDRAIPGLRAQGALRSDLLLRALRVRALVEAGDTERAEAERQEVEAEIDGGCGDDPRIRAELETARRKLAAPAEEPTMPDLAMDARDEQGGVPRTVFRSFLAINRRLASEDDLERAMLHLLEAAETVTGARASYLLVERDGAVHLEVASRIGPVGDRAFSRSLANKAISMQRTMTAEDAVADRDLMAMPSVQDLRMRSALCAPFRAASGAIGALYVEHPNRRGAFGGREAEYLEALADQAAIAVDRMLREEALERALESTQRDLAVVSRRTKGKGVRLIGESPAIEELRRQVDRFARSDLPILVYGETGTGKELVARLLHERSARASGPFVSENCSAIPAELMESELFGHVQGSFTGATSDRPGLLELADGGTLFLDEVGDMTPEMQVKLLRVLQERSVRRVGGRENVPIDVRLVTATHRDLRARIEDGAFREDLYFRIAAGVVRVPPLRERGTDVVLLARHFITTLNVEQRRDVRIDDATAIRLAAYSFPGNVRELEHLIARTYLLTEGDALQLDEDLPRSAEESRTDRPWPALPLVEATYRTIHAALRATAGDKTAAAKLLGISRTALYDKLKREAVDRPAGSS